MDDFQITPEILEQFQVESRENIKDAENALLLIEKSGHVNSAIHDLFRPIHTIKGSAAYLELKDLNVLSHAFENILDGLRKREQMPISSDLINLFFKILDAIALMVDQAGATSFEAVSFNHLLEELSQLKLPSEKNDVQDGSKASSSTHQRIDVENRTLKVFLDSVGQQREVLLFVLNSLKLNPSLDSTMKVKVSRALQGIRNASKFIGEEKLENLSGDLRGWLLFSDGSDDIWEFILKLNQYMDELECVLNSIGKGDGKHLKAEAHVFSADEAKDLKEEILKINPLSGENLEKIQGLQGSVNSQTVRVYQRVLDGFMNLVGELIVARNAFSHIQNKFLGTEDDRHIAMKEFRESSNRLTHITEALQRNVMEMRMVPVKTLFERYPRIVRDVCSKTGKNVEVIFEGEDTEIDKGIADQISEPLIHIVRNAVDHGIESKEDRIDAGKAESGTLLMKASHQGNYIVIEIIDDGAGIDAEKVKLKAIEKGLLTKEEAALSSTTEILEYIFAPGFSTASTVTDISGRGVGLDVVKTNLDRIKGHVSVTTELKQGTCFRLEVPLTIAILRALLVKSNQSVYAIDLQDVAETVKVAQSELSTIRQQKAITIRGEIVTIEWLSELLGCSSVTESSEDLKVPILILQVKEKRFGLIVDSVFKQEEIVVKPLPDFYANVQGLSGASILGDGKAILILDAGQLYSLLVNKNGEKQSSNSDLNYLLQRQKVA